MTVEVYGHRTEGRIGYSDAFSRSTVAGNFATIEDAHNAATAVRKAATAATMGFGLEL